MQAQGVGGEGVMNLIFFGAVALNRQLCYCTLAQLLLLVDIIGLAPAVTLLAVTSIPAIALALTPCRKEQEKGLGSSPVEAPSQSRVEGARGTNEIPSFDAQCSRCSYPTQLFFSVVPSVCQLALSVCLSAVDDDILSPPGWSARY